MILTGHIGKFTVGLLMKFPTFNRHFAVLGSANTFIIFRSIPAEKLKRTQITTANFLRFKFDVYDAFQLLKEYTAQISILDETNNSISINVWDSRQMNTLVKEFSLLLTDQTFFELKELIGRKVFNEKTKGTYNYFISIYLQRDIKKIKDRDRRFAEGTLMYSLRSEKNNKEKRLKVKFSLTKQEAVTICSNISYW
jgi:hypothetical protein